MQHGIRWRVSCSLYHRKHSCTWNKAHREPGTSTAFDIKLRGNLITAVSFCIHTRLKTHNIIESILIPRSDERAPVCHVRNLHQCNFACSRNYFSILCRPKNPRTAQTATKGFVLHNSLFLLIQGKILWILIRDILNSQRISVIHKRKTLGDSVYNIIV